MEGAGILKNSTAPKGRRLQNREGERVKGHEALARVHVDADFPVARPDAGGAGPEVAVLPPPLFVHDVLLVSLPLLDSIAPELCSESVIHPDIFQTHEPIQRIAILEDLVWRVARVEPIGVGATSHRTVARQAALVVGVTVRIARHRELDCFERHKVRFRVSSHGELELPVARLRLGQAGPEVTAVPAPNRIHVDLVASPLPHVDAVAVRLHLVRVVDLDVRQVDQTGDVVTLLKRRRRIVARVDPIRLGPTRDRTFAHHAVRREVVLGQIQVRLDEHVGVVPVVVDTVRDGIAGVEPAAITGKVFLVLAVSTFVDADVHVRGPVPAIV